MHGCQRAHHLLTVLLTARADNVGDNVGDIAGMGADLFGSFAESTCAALVVASVSELGNSHNWTAMMFPLFITASGIIVCLLTTLLATDISPARSIPTIEPTLKTQLIVSTLLMTPVIFLIAFITLPSSFDMPYPGDLTLHVKWYYMFFCVSAGLWGGMVIGVTTEYYTSNTYRPVRDVADASRTGAATLIIFGLALGYLSVIIPVFVIAICIYVGARAAGSLVPHVLRRPCICFVCGEGAIRCSMVHWSFL
jgi:H+-translocating diphosphatase